MGYRSYPLFYALIISIIITLIFPISVIADDATPPPPTEEPVSPPLEDTNPVTDPVEPPPSSTTEEVNATADPIEPVPSVLPVDATDTPSEQEEELIDYPLLSTLPEDTSVIVEIDGQVEPLATQEAAIAVVVGDPIWCPEGASPIPTSGGCTDSYGNLEDLIDDILNGVISVPSDDGVIWITNTSDTSTSNIEIDGSDPALLTWSNFNLTIQGGWTGTSAGIISGSSIFSVPLSIINWNGDVVVNNLTFDNVNSTGLVVQTVDADIEINNIISIDNSGVGNNGIDLSVDDTLSVTGGNVTANNVTVSGNAGMGLSITGFVNDVILTTVTADDNGETGIYVEAFGDIDADSLSTSSNGVNGVFIDSGGGVIILGTNIFDDNGETGLYIDAVDDVEIENVSADSNGTSGVGNGAEIYSASGSVSVINNNLNVFDDNADSGLYIEAFMDIDAENISASNNGADGAFLNAGRSISILGNNIFDNNSSAVGLYAEAVDDIDTENLFADGNGVELFAGNNISMIGNNEFLNNTAGPGLFVETAVGNIDAENIIADGNGGVGVEMDAGGTITLTGNNQFNNNTLDGLLAYAGGDIYIEDTEAVNNGGVGVYVDTPAGATIVCSLMSGNNGYQLEADTGGFLTLIGTNFGTSIDTDLGADEDRLILISNSCFTYTFSLGEDDDNEDDDDGGSSSEINVIVPPLPIANKNGIDRQITNLDCKLYSGTVLSLENGNRAYIPCPIIDSARLANVPEQGLITKLPNGGQFVSALILDIYRNGRLVGPSGEAGLIDFSNVSNPAGTPNYVYVYWDGTDWVEVTDQTFPFMGIYFVATPEMMREDLAILFWDGSKWVELVDGAQFGQGREVGLGGRFVEFEGQMYFGATVNFTGEFVLVKK